ncbi:MAG: hypothetical protein IT184_17785 [Acidobacteria bacterium]|nr:hypothetical protein [Acidobacteriota bacterium]
MGESLFAGGMLWLFLALVIVANVWREIAARREAQQTVRLAIEKNYPIDSALIEKMLRTPARKSKTDLLAGGAVLVAIGLGLPLMGVFIYLGGSRDALLPLVGVGSMLLLMGLALLIVAHVVRPRQAADTDAPRL